MIKQVRIWNANLNINVRHALLAPDALNRRLNVRRFQHIQTEIILNYLVQSWPILVNLECNGMEWNVWNKNNVQTLPCCTLYNYLT